MRSFLAFLRDYLRWCAAVALLALLVFGVPAALCLVVWWPK